MKNKLFSTFIFAIAALGLQAQDLQIHRTDGTITLIQLSSIDSITFTAGATVGEWKPCPGTPTITDIDGNFYNTVLIGNQCWMKENLKVTNYLDGTAIENPLTDLDWQNNTNGGYAWYNNDISWKDPYGALYNWYAVNNSSGLCPSGWHVPTDTEWVDLIFYLDIYTAGGKLKSTRTEPDAHPRWNIPNYGATNESGFSSFPGGNRSEDGTFRLLGSSCGFWSSSTENGSIFAWHRSWFSNSDETSRDYSPKQYGSSIRCIKD